MKNKYNHLNQFDRDRIEAMLKAGHKRYEIAQVLNKDKTTISREINRNCRKIRETGGNKDGPYVSRVANHKTYVRRRASKYQGLKIRSNQDLERYIIEKLKLHWSPDEISGRMKKDKEPFYASKDLIYAWLYSIWGQEHTKYLYQKRDRKRKRRKKKTSKVMIPNRVGIEARSEDINKMISYGHLEADTIVSGKSSKSKKSLAVIYERKAKYLDARVIKNLKPKVMIRSVKDMNTKINNTKSITFDNGIENREHEKLHKLEIETYFCNPYSSWQKGGVENANKMIRRYIPKSSDISNCSHQYVTMIIQRINNKPRKSLGYKTPLEVMIKNNLLTKKRAKKLSEKSCT